MADNRSQEPVGHDELNDMLRQAELANALHVCNGCFVVRPTNRHRPPEMIMMGDAGVESHPVVLVTFHTLRLPSGSPGSFIVGIPVDFAERIGAELVDTAQASRGTDASA